ncbi:Flp pilus assembly complex ATPase component TadA [Pseudoalteromonas sp. OFAV1]|jgi:general secretion pathway protein E|uniref:GspE/PulE family protein n=1 Tax=Pseudoalteromonas sp. OFAV1 TaxID=2908892 RepID=UPI001F447FD9|nr:ATPase, T2SS/T4P/T4SS family [Pseudoalteromonas sp. OFAV1]MCF2901852.1 Flp pilus assembly complex ATPase component TadA [Pseudoalteromonas sp. OFAV1]
MSSISLDKDNDFPKSISKKDALIEDILITRNHVSQTELNAAKFQSSVTNESIGPILVKLGFLQQDTLIEILLETTDESISEEELILPNVPHDILIQTKTKISTQTPDAVYLGTTGDEDEVEYLLKPYFNGREIKFINVEPDDVESYLDKLTTINDSESSVMENIIRKAIMSSVSDIHIQPRDESYTVFYRHLGVRKIVKEGTLEEYNQLNARIKDRSKMDLAERRVPQDGGFKIDFNGRIVDLRVATLPMNEGEKITIRILDPQTANVKIDNIGISNLEGWRNSTSRADGIALICGPTGSGKTTTLNATVKDLARFDKSIYTAEDPVEYSIPYVDQVNINESVGLDFSRAIRAFMRADPDLILVGEIRDIDTARNAIKGAETGHLVMGTLHTGSIKGAIERLRDIGVEAHEMKHILRGILVQRLMRVLCTRCYGNDPHCSDCMGGGYSARTIISECHYFETDQEVRRLLETEDVFWKTMIEDAYDKYIDNRTTYEELYRIFGSSTRQIITNKGFNEYDRERISKGILNIEEIR